MIRSKKHHKNCKRSDKKLAIELKKKGEKDKCISVIDEKRKQDDKFKRIMKKNFVYKQRVDTIEVFINQIEMVSILKNSVN